ncbi:MAG: GGDEF domain-containing protein [Clostridia bacterium]|nr:GGDEF domain-containing protein [Clostridia bacterium]
MKSSWLIFSVFVMLAMALVIAALSLHIRKMRKENMEDKITDAETGMGNLEFFKHHFRYTINDTSRSLYHLAYIILDISYLRSYHKDITYGDVLKHTALVLTEHAEEGEISARITENSFAFAFKAVTQDYAKRRLEDIMNRLNSIEETKKINSNLVFHCAVYPLVGTDRNPEILLFNLRKNCNKILGTEKQIVYCDIHSMNKTEEDKKNTENILNGLKNNEFKMYLQPVIDNKTKKVASCEALSRWDRGKKGIVGPGDYLPAMEASGIIGRHDFYMFSLACRQLEKWKDTNYKDISISCNFTRLTLSEENFTQRLEEIAINYNFDRKKLAIEITEDAIEKDRDIATENVRKCKELGFLVYLDDLGSGYTSLANLCDYPIDIVKIDRDILLKTDTPRGKDLFSGIIALSHNLNMKVICEGVETEEQNALVCASACDFIQGWYYSKPCPPEKVETLIDNNFK